MTQHNILVAADLTEESLQILGQSENVNIQMIPPKTENIRQKLNGANVLITRDVNIDASLIETATELKIIARIAASTDGIDIEAASQRGIIVMNTPGVSAIAAGEHTLALMLALSRKLTIVHNSLKEGWWLLDRKRQAGTQLSGKTLGIIGLGRVGQIVAQRCLAFGMTVLAYDPYLSEEQTPDNRIMLVGFKELLQRSDFISLHVPATSETRLLLNQKAIKLIKPGARLINTSHGSIIDEEALAAALKTGKLAGAAIDVFSEEPPYNSPLIGIDSVIHTPHVGDNTIEAMQDLSIQVVRQVLDALNDRDYRNVVNMPLIPGVDFGRIRPYLQLAEKIGKLHHTLARSPVQRVAIEVRGEETSGLIKPMTVGLLKGLLSPILGDKVSYVNAPILAAERGWQVTQAKGLKTAEYFNIVICQITLEDGEVITITGTLLDHREPHIVRVNEYITNFVPNGCLLILGSYDKPGVIGRIGSLLADNNINIASWQTGRAAPGGNTLTVLTLDHPISKDLLEELRKLAFVRHAHQVDMGWQGSLEAFRP